MLRFLLLFSFLALIFGGSMQAAEKHAVLAVFAHPDDETSVGALLAKLADEGHSVYLVSITSGQKGVTAHAGIPAGEKLGAAREEELRCAAKALGIHEPFLLGFEDQGISSPAAKAKVAGRLREIISQVKPDVIVTWGPDGVTGHPDHRAASNITTEVFQQRSLLKHRPRKLYYVVVPESRLHGLAPPFDERPPRAVSDLFITTQIDCRPFQSNLKASVACHKTQWTPEMMEALLTLNAGTLDGRVFLRLALSDVSAETAKETSLFDGLR